MTSRSTLRCLVGVVLIGCAAASNAQSAGPMLDRLPSCSWPSLLPWDWCLRGDPEVARCARDPYHPLCEDFPGAVKAVSAQTKRHGACYAEYEITFKSPTGELRALSKYQHVDCTTGELLD